jgi:hypothetical protein
MFWAWQFNRGSTFFQFLAFPLILSLPLIKLRSIDWGRIRLCHSLFHDTAEPVMTNMGLRSSFRAEVTIMHGTNRSAKVEKRGASP